MDDLPAPPVNDRTLLEKIEAGTITATEFEAAVIDQVYAGMQQYCEIPEAYQHCELTSRQLDIESLPVQESRATEGEVGYTTLTSQGHDYEKRSAPADEFWEAISDFQMRLAGYRYQPANRPHLHRLQGTRRGGARCKARSDGRARDRAGRVH